MQRKSTMSRSLTVPGLPSRFRVIKKLGSGSYGSVYAAKDTKMNRIVAIKVIENLFDDLIDAKRVLREICLLRQMNSPHIVKMLECNYIGRKNQFNSIYVVMEYHQKDLRSFIKSNRSLTRTDAKRLIYNMLCGVLYLHSCKVLHRDIKPANILVDDKLNVKICDFGLARSIAEFEEDLNAIDHGSCIDESIKEKYSEYNTSETLHTDGVDLSFELQDEKSPGLGGMKSPERKLEEDEYFLTPESQGSNYYGSSNSIVKAYGKLIFLSVMREVEQQKAES